MQMIRSKLASYDAEAILDVLQACMDALAKRDMPSRALDMIEDAILACEDVIADQNAQHASNQTETNNDARYLAFKERRDDERNAA